MTDSSPAILIAKAQEQNSQQFQSLRTSIETMAAGIADLTQTLVRIEERHAGHKSDIERIEDDQQDHENRIRVLERAQWKIIGAAIGCSSLMSLLLTILGVYLARVA